ncbi:DNA gyrase subunit A [Thalassoporum mexicanum PCC 7367]|uniref:DNA gyrase subunit A n=1 Tax=Thalassoporum mexicanum TaxID=3457544 RepID=UPI00029FAE41|nr:DNA gyrase subunit A [Pseudanabaena sp. PCC 7367]AFY70303.1 DNA gyrase subunit A [Pseudanabaena sp. PCC 7367]
MTNSTHTPNDRIIPTDLRGEMSRSYLEYAMSVIVGRALPDARDGLKPVHRRILYAMHELNLSADRPFRKCARVVGDVIGKYHPHGDTAVYDALVRMAQDFSMRDRLVDGHGNFGSVDNDPPAAMRYTECRLTRIAQDSLLQDISFDTVNFADNYDGSQQEPIVMPSRLPQLLLNGSSGIAVGMATNIPPHNLSELVDGLVALIDDPELSDLDLITLIPGPDFPTGALILGKQAIRDTYATGRGSIAMRAVTEIETVSAPGRQEKEAIIVTELPYQTNKAALIEKIAELVNDKRLDGISDIRDESDRTGMRIVIELRRDAYPQVVVNNLFKLTPMQSNFSCNMLALVDGEPRILSLRDTLTVFIDFRVNVVTRRTQYELRKAEERDHLLQGFLIALANLDEVIALIRGADDTAEARGSLMTNYELSQAQADGILQMQLRRLTALEVGKIEQEHNELVAKIADLRDILANRDRIMAIIREELEAAKAAFATPRRTQILEAEGEIDTADLIANREAIILITERGYIKRLPVDIFAAQNRATRGKAGTSMKEDDAVEHFFACRSHDSLLFFSDRGKVYSLRAYEIHEGSRTSRGSALVQMLPIAGDEKFTSVIPVSEFAEDEYLVMLTAGGYIKKTKLSAFANIRTNGLIAISLEPDDTLSWVRRASADNTIIIGSKDGIGIRFRTDNEQLRPMGRDTRGVRAMKLGKGDQLVSMDILPAGLAEVEGGDDNGDDNCGSDLETSETESSEVNEGPWVLVVTQDGAGKRVPVDQFRIQRRAGRGCRVTKFKHGDDQLAALRLVNEDDELILITARGIVMRQAVDAIACQSRSAKGVRVQRLDDDDAIVGVALVPNADEDDELEEGEELEGVDGEAIDVEAIAVDSDPSSNASTVNGAAPANNGDNAAEDTTNSTEENT